LTIVVSEGAPFYITAMVMGCFVIWLLIIFLTLSVNGVERDEMGCIGTIATGISTVIKGIGGIAIIVTDTFIGITKGISDIIISITKGISDIIIVVAEGISDIIVVVAEGISDIIVVVAEGFTSIAEELLRAWGIGRRDEASNTEVNIEADIHAALNSGVPAYSPPPYYVSGDIFL
jgi:hypothetical protein